MFGDMCLVCFYKGGMLLILIKQIKQIGKNDLRHLSFINGYVSIKKVAGTLVAGS